MNGQAAADFIVLARHHRECEHIAEEMAALLREVAQGATRWELDKRLSEVHDRWERHQWPDLDSRLAATLGEVT